MKDGFMGQGGLILSPYKAYPPFHQRLKFEMIITPAQMIAYLSLSVWHDPQLSC